MKKYFITLTATFFVTILYGQTQTPQFVWAKKFGGTGDDKSNKMILDHQENIITVGRFHSKIIMFDKIKLINSDQDSSTSSDVFITKCNSEGKVLWAKSFGGYGDDLATHVVTDKKGNIILIGVFDCEIFMAGSYRFINNTKKGEGSDIFIIKFSSDGEIIWAKSFGNEKSDGGYDTCVMDEDGNIYFSGAFYSATLPIDTITLTNSGKGSETFIAKFNSEGKVLWAKTAKGINNDLPQSCALDSIGNLIIAGYYTGATIIFDSITLHNANIDTAKKISAETSDIFVAKYSSNGNLLWAKSFGGPSANVATCKTDVHGNIFLAGMFSDSTFVLGNTSLNNNSDMRSKDFQMCLDIFIAKLDNAGNVLWARSAGGKSADAVRNFCIDNKGNCILTGFFLSPILTFDNITLNKIGKEDEDEDMFIVSYSPEGNVIWAKHTGGKGRNTGKYCISDKNGDVYLTGFFEASSTLFDSITLNNSGIYDIFITKLKIPKRGK